MAPAVDAHRENLGLLERIVNINSGTMNIPESPRARRARSTPEALGFKAMESHGIGGYRAGESPGQHPCPSGRTVRKEAFADRTHGHGLRARGPFQAYRLYGNFRQRGFRPGVNDMKGGLVVISALNAMKTAGVLIAQKSLSC